MNHFVVISLSSDFLHQLQLAYKSRFSLNMAEKVTKNEITKQNYSTEHLRDFDLRKNPRVTNSMSALRAPSSFST